MKALSTVNQAMDSMTQIMTGGPAGMAALFGMLRRHPDAPSPHAGMKLQPPPAHRGDSAGPHLVHHRQRRGGLEYVRRARA